MVLEAQVGSSWVTWIASGVSSMSWLVLGIEVVRVVRLEEGGHVEPVSWRSHSQSARYFFIEAGFVGVLAVFILGQAGGDLDELLPGQALSGSLEGGSMPPL